MITPEELVEKLRAAKQSKKKGGGSGSTYDIIREEIATIEHELRRLKQELDRLEDAYEHGDITAEELDKRREDVAERREQLFKETETLRDHVSKEDTAAEKPELSGALEDRLNRLEEEMQEEVDEKLSAVTAEKPSQETRGTEEGTAPRRTVTVEQEEPAARSGEAQETIVTQEKTDVQRMAVEGSANIQGGTVQVTEGGGGQGVESPFDEEDMDLPQQPEEEEDLSTIDIRYPLTPQNPERGDVVYAWAHITYDEAEDELRYLVDEPEMTPEIRDVLEEVEEILKETIDVDFSTLQEDEAKTFLEDRIAEIVEEYEFGLDQEQLEILEYYAKRDFIGLGKLQPIMNDPEIEDVSCDGVGIPIFVYHRDPRIGSVKTNVVYNDEDILDSFIIKLAQRCGRSVSVADPLLDGSLPDGSRVQATLATDIARRGSNFTIRKFTEDPLTPVHMMGFGTMNADMLAYLWFLVEYGKSILIAGPTASGKTSMLNALSLFIRPELKIVSIEDTPELRLPHPHWIPETSRAGYGFGDEKSGEVTLHDLLKESLRQRPDYIIVGEVRGKEAYVLFQQMASIPGEEDVLVLNGDELKRMPIEDVDAQQVTGVPTLNTENGAVEIKDLERKATHQPVDTVYRITTETGREVVTTGNHSVFTSETEAAVVDELGEGDDIAVPARIPAGYQDKDYINLLTLDGIRVHAPDLVKEAQEELGFDEASAIVDRASISNYYGVNNCALPADKFTDLMDAAGIDYSLDELTVRFENRSTTMPAKLPVTDELLRFLGYFIADGSLNPAYKNNNIQLYNNDTEILDDIRHCINEICGKTPRERVRGEYGDCTELSFSNKVLYEFLAQHAYKDGEKQVPDFVFGLSKERIGEVLTGLYRGDGHLRDKDFTYFTTSRRLANDVNTLLLSLGILPRIRHRNRDGRDKTDYEVVFYTQREKGAFLNYVTPVTDHSETPRREWGREDEVFIDTVADIEEIEKETAEPVFDLSVPGTQNFIGGFGGVILHNTGHPGMSTIHAPSLDKVMDRLTTKPIDLPANLIQNIDALLFMRSVRYKGKHIRRAANIYEIEGFDTGKNAPIANKTFSWEPQQDTFTAAGNSSHLMTIAREHGFDTNYVKKELARRSQILQWMYDQGIYDYRKVGHIVSAYYVNPEKVLNKVKSTQ